MLRRLSKSLLGPLPRRRQNPSAPRQGRCRLAVEALEDRRLLTASYVSDQVLLQFKPGVSEEAQGLVRQGVAATGYHPLLRAGAGEGTELLSFRPGRTVDNVIQQLKNNPLVAYAEPNWVLTKQAVSNDAKYLDGSLWGMYGDDATITPDVTTNEYGSQAEEVWSAGNTGSQSVIVGVIDEGIDLNHPDLAANIWTNPFDDPNDTVDNDGNGYVNDTHGWDFYQNNNTIYDGSPTDSTTDEHGTHVAGTIGGVGGNGVGVAGVNWDVTIISGKFLGPNGGSIANAIKAVDYFTDLKTRHGLNIVALNNSWGGGGYSQAMQDAITRAANANILFIAAAGNGGSDQVGDNNDSVASYPSNYNTSAGAGYDSVVAVAAINNTGGLASFSNYGATTVDVGAPGEGVVSTTPNGGYIAYSGTSMATPHVTGAAALYAAAFPGASASQIKNAILDAARATPTTSLSGKTVTGGRLNASEFYARNNDLGIAGVSTSSTSVTQGGTVNVTVTVKNTGKDATAAGATVTLTSDNGTAGTTDDFTIGTQIVAVSLLAGDSTTVRFTWDTNATNERAGNHVLTASLPADGYVGNNTATATITVVDPNAPKTPLYLTVPDAGTVTLGGLSVQNEDIVYYDGTNYSLFFDGTPELGGSSGGFAIDSVAVLSANEFLISVDQYGGLNRTSLTVYDEDIIRFKRNSASDAWAASMYFDGSDVGLSTSIFAGTGGAEGVDAFELLSDGRLLVSTKGGFSVSGVSGADEDVIAFKPTQLGSTTKGSWAMYVDGSRYGLEDGGENEDVDGISVDGNGKLYLSTAGTFAVPITGGTLSGTGADVFVFDLTAKTYSPTLYFAGSTLGGKNLFSVDLPPGFVGPTSSMSSLTAAALDTERPREPSQGVDRAAPMKEEPKAGASQGILPDIWSPVPKRRPSPRAGAEASASQSTATEADVFFAELGKPDMGLEWRFSRD